MCASYCEVLCHLSIRRDVINVFLFLIRALVSAVYQAVTVYTPEVYPTTVRAAAVGFCSAAARAGGMTAPFIAQVSHVDI